MSQRECAEFNWPPLVIPASEPVGVSPEAVNRAGLSAISIAKSFRFDPCRVSPIALAACPPFQSRVVGVGQPAGDVHNATVLRLLSLFPAALFPFCAGVPASHDTRPSSAFSGTFRHSLPSL